LADVATTVEVAIIGSGLSGLTLALQLTSRPG
jgi:2-polyprenyl-6-methoxyphenol hydroxylase-like FAD-dependent oxidoreductase